MILCELCFVVMLLSGWFVGCACSLWLCRLVVFLCLRDLVLLVCIVRLALIELLCAWFVVYVDLAVCWYDAGLGYGLVVVRVVF